MDSENQIKCRDGGPVGNSTSEVVEEEKKVHSLPPCCSVPTTT